MEFTTDNKPRGRPAFPVLLSAMMILLAAKSEAVPVLLHPAADAPSDPPYSPWPTIVGQPTAWQVLDRGTSQPYDFSGDATRFIYAGGGNYQTVVKLEAADFGGRIPAVSRAWFFANTGSGTSLKVEVICNGVRAPMPGNCKNSFEPDSTPTNTVLESQAFQWRSVGFTPPDNLTDLRLSFTAMGGPGSQGTNVRAAYVALQSSPPASSSMPITPTDYLTPAADVTAGAWLVVEGTTRGIPQFQAIAKNHLQPNGVPAFPQIYANGSPSRTARVQRVG